MTDTFSYLENTDNAETKDFYRRFNNVTDSYISKNKYYSMFVDELTRVSKTDLRGLPYIAGSRTFYVERKHDSLKPKLVMETGDKNEILLDFDNTEESLDFWYPSDNGEYVLFGTSVGGNEQTTIRIVEASTRKFLDDNIPFAGFTDQGSICWLNETSFIYPRMNGFSGTGGKDKWLLGSKLYLHVIGDDPTLDELVYGQNLPDTVMLTPTLSRDKKTLYVTVCEDELTHRVVAVDVLTRESRDIKCAEKGACYVKTAPGQVYVLTNYGAENYRILSCEERRMRFDLDEWDEVIPESDDVLQDFWIHSSKNIIAQYSHKVSSRLKIFDSYGNQTGAIEIPKHSIVSGLRCFEGSSSIYYFVTGFTTPSAMYCLNDLTAKPRCIWQREHANGDDEIVFDQFWATSKDGTRIPYFVVRRKDVVDAAPTVMYGYGGFNIPIEPSYLSSSRAWVMEGGVYVLMNLRGGSEFGERWHKAGSLDKKQNTFDDCTAIAEDLLHRGITTSENLGVLGGSNGGLLVAAVTLQRPDLFRAGASLVPLTDMLEFYKHQVAEFWVHEYGDPRIDTERAWIKKWSPYHYPIDDNTSYPALYYETALDDARVHPFHALKMVARLESTVRAWKGPLLLRTRTDTGHQSSNKTTEELAKQTAEYYAFFAQELGLSPILP